MSSRESGAKTSTATMIAAAMGTLTSSVEPHQNPSSSAPVTMGPIDAPAPANPAQTAMARAARGAGRSTVMIDRVAGMMNAAPMPMTARLAITCEASDARPASSAPTPKTASPPSRAPPAAEAVADRSRGEQQAGEHDRVGVDDPLELGRRRAEVALHRRQRGVEPGHRHHDEDERQAHDRQQEPATGVDLGLLVQRDRGTVTDGEATVSSFGGDGT